MRNTARQRLVAFTATVVTVLLPLAITGVRAHDEQKKTWDPEVKWAGSDKEFKQRDAKNPPAPGGVVFFGSSSFRMWDVERFFPKLNVINRGFGGSTMPDAIYFAERWVAPLKPKCILIYEGDNDIKNGWTADEVFANYQTLIEKFESTVPGTPVIFVAIKPSVSRWTMWKEMNKANQLIANFSKKHDHLYYADIATPMFEYNGLPKSFLFKSDGLHLNDVGYEVWKTVVEPLINSAVSE